MRRPWAARPGMVRVPQRDWIHLLERALRSGEAREASREAAAENAQRRTRARAAELLVVREHALGAALTTAARAGLLASLPVTTSGDLHETAFIAWVDAELWAGWSERLAAYDDRDDTRRTT